MSAPSVLLVGGPLDGIRTPLPALDGDVVWFGDVMPFDPAKGNEPIPAKAGVHRYIRTQINDGSGGSEVVYRFGTLGRRDALRLLVNHYPDRRYSPPASLDDPA